MTEPKIIFFDIDGTLLSPITHHIEASTIKVLHQLQAKGYQLGLATGRSFEATKNTGLLDVLQWDALVLNNGHKVFDQQLNVIFEAKIDPQTVQQFIDAAHQRNIAVMGQGDSWHMYCDENDIVREIHAVLGDVPEKEIFDPSIPIYSLMVYGTDTEFVESFKALKPITMHNYSDIVIDGIHKYTGIKKVLEHLNLESYIGMGDSLNDYEMAKHAKLFIATHQAHPKLKKLAQFVVKSEQDEIEKGMKQSGLL